MTQTMSEMRQSLRLALACNIVMESVRIIRHDPWTIVSFKTYLPPKRFRRRKMIQLVGVSKRCYKDEWDEKTGIEVAVNRAIAWEVRKRIGPAVEVHDE